MNVRKLMAAAFVAGLWLASPGAAPALAADCSGAAAQVVGQTGGQLLSANPVNQGGRTVCQVTVLVQGNGNERPKKVTVNVPI